MSDSPHFAIVTRDALLSLDRQVLLESRLIHGKAEQQGDAIEARDDRDDELLAMCDAEVKRVRAALSKFGRGYARAVVSAQRDGASATIALTINAMSLVTDVEHLADDYSLLERLSTRNALHAVPAGLPLVWRNGSGAVLMHEAVGHAEEHPHSDRRWQIEVNVSRAVRRASFSDVPRARMTAVRVSAANQNSSLPDPRVDILLVAGGRYEPLTESVSISVAAADLIDGGRVIPLEPFIVERMRSEIAETVRAANNRVERYPGVICSSEGQELFVESYAPDLVMER